MPYKISKRDHGYQVTTPNHPSGGFSKKPQTKAGAIKQMVAIKMNTGENSSGRKIGVKKKGQ